MLQQWRTWLETPRFESDEQNRIANLLYPAILFGILVVTVTAIGLLFLPELNPVIMLGSVGVLAGIQIVLLMAIRRGRVREAGLAYVALVWLTVTVMAYFFAGVRSGTYTTYLIVLLVAGAIGRTTLLTTTGFTLASGFAFVWLAQTGQLPPPPPGTMTDANIFGTLAAVVVMVAFLVYLSQRGAQELLSQVRQNEHDLSQSNEALKAMQLALEDRVADRTRSLEIVVALSERFNTILDLDELLSEVVHRTQETFGYYHVHIYRLDQTQRLLTVAAGTGRAGEQMLRQGHAISLDAPASLVARAARRRDVVLVSDVYQAEDWLPNELLPHTRAEMAVPILFGQDHTVLGVLDVQADHLAGLTEADEDVLRSLANQVAVSIRNAQLFASAEAALNEAQMAQERYLSQAWEAGRLITGAARHRYQSTDAPAANVAPLTTEVRIHNSAIGEVQVQPHPAQTQLSDDDQAVLAAVIDQLAQTAESLRLFEETQERAGREQVLRQITDRLRAAPDLDRLLNVAAETLGHYLDVERVVLELGTTPNALQSAATNGNGLLHSDPRQKG